jgi:hypothetical protein
LQGGRAGAWDSETIEAALDLVTFGPELVEGVRAMRGAGLVDVFSDDLMTTSAKGLEWDRPSLAPSGGCG